MPPRWIFLDTRELELRLVAALHERHGCTDVIDVAVYRGQGAAWWVGHIRLRPSGNCRLEAVATLQNEFRAIYRIRR